MKYSGIGGQAVIEGIMMKNGEDYSVAVRKPDRTIEVKKDKYISFSDRHKWAKLPFIRGIFAFGESMILGMRALTFSASFFEDDEEEKPSKFELWLEKTFGENLEKGVLGFVGKRHAVKNEELGFGTKESLVTDAGALEIIFGTACKRTGITRIALAGIGLENIASQNESVLFTERIHAGRFRVGHQNHVARFNAFPAGHRRAVKGLSVFESVFGELMGRHGHVLFFAAGIGQTIINELDIVVFNHLQNVCGRGHD